MFVSKAAFPATHVHSEVCFCTYSFPLFARPVFPMRNLRHQPDRIMSLFLTFFINASCCYIAAASEVGRNLNYRRHSPQNFKTVFSIVPTHSCFHDWCPIDQMPSIWQLSRGFYKIFPVSTYTALYTSI